MLAASKLKNMTEQLKREAKSADGADYVDYTTKSILLSASNLLSVPMSISKEITKEAGENKLH